MYTQCTCTANVGIQVRKYRSLPEAYWKQRNRRNRRNEGVFIYLDPTIHYSACSIALCINILPKQQFLSLFARE
jgi:hypothetical protein